MASSPVIELLRILFTFVFRSIAVFCEWLWKVVEFLLVSSRTSNPDLMITALNYSNGIYFMRIIIITGLYRNIYNSDEFINQHVCLVS